MHVGASPYRVDAGARAASREPDGTAVIENDAVDRISRECRERDLDHSSDTIAEKGWELIRQWAGFYDVLPESATPDR